MGIATVMYSYCVTVFDSLSGTENHTKAQNSKQSLPISLSLPPPSLSLSQQSWSQAMQDEDLSLAGNLTSHYNGDAGASEREREALRKLGLPPIRKSANIGEKQVWYGGEFPGVSPVTIASQKLFVHVHMCRLYCIHFEM